VPASADPRIETELLGYRIEALLGRGGMSVVYRAEDLRLKRKVALKLLAPQLAEDERFRERFLRESELAASIDHPHVIPIYEAGEAGGLLFIAMRYVEGSDLRRLLETERRLEPKRALALLAQVASALDAAHQRGLVHRDVKPANILIAEGEQVYLADFGLTKQASAEHGLTESNQFIGTGDYMAPEQIERQPIDGRTDVYALGCVLYQCLTGTVPYPAERLMATLWAHVNDPPPALVAYPPLDPVIGTALAKSPDERYPSCGALIDAARVALSEPKARTSRRRWLATGAFLALAAATAIPAVLLTRGRARGATASISVDSLQRIDPRTNRLVATIPAGGQPVGVAVGAGAVWVIDDDERTLLRVDPKGNAVAKINLARALTPTAVAAGAGAVWMIAGAHGIPGRLLWRYDPVRRSLSAAPVNVLPFSLSVGERAVWVEDLAHEPDSLLRVGTADGRALGYVAACACAAPAFGANGVWTDSSNPSASGGGSISRLGSGGTKVVAQIPLSFDPASTQGATPPKEIAVGEGGVWVANRLADTVARIDSETNRLAEAFPTGRDPAAIAVGAGAVWVANDRDGSVTRYDPKTADISTIQVGGTPVAIAVGFGGVWVATQLR
jgi:serine/threonine-protein kinase